MTSGLELSENHSELRQRGGRRTRHCMLSRLQVAVFVAVAILLMAVVGMLMAMFGPGSKNLKYRDDEDCKGRKDVCTCRGIESVPQTTRVSESFGPCEESRKRICWVRARGGGLLKEFLGGDVSLGPWNP